MIKNIGILALLAGIIILGLEEFKELLNILYDSNMFFRHYLEAIFSDGKIGVFLCEFIALLIVCGSITLIPVAIYILALKKRFPWSPETFAIVMIMSSSALALH